MKNNKKQEHPNFLKYKNFILNHNNYQGLYTNDQEKRWVAPGKTELGKKRKLWWLLLKKKYEKNGIKFSDNALLSPVCLFHHPTKIKNCHVCGQPWRLEYVYPTKKTLNKINLIFKKNFITRNDLSIFKIIKELFNIEKNFNDLDEIFSGIKNLKSIDDINKFIQLNYIST